MMDQRFDELLQKYISGTATLEEQMELQAWYESKNEAEIFWQADAADEEQIVRDRLLSGITARMNRSKPKSKRLWTRWVAAASIASAIFAGGYFYYSSQTNNDNTELTAANDIAPGKNGATLTLANGKKIYINDALAGNLASEAGVKISKTKDGQLIYEVTGSDNDILAYNTLTTTRGEQSQVRLPDGSLVFLNAESSLKYPTSFARQEKRSVVLSGEAYFEIAKDKKHPFIVQAEKQQVEVLGTHFNINAYNNNAQIRTTLLEGSVKVTSTETEKSQLLAPGQQATFDGKTIEVAPADINEAVAWKEGDFIYNNVPLETIMKDISRWYNIDVDFADASLKKKTIYINADRYGKVSEFLKPLGRIAKVDFEIKNDKIIVARKKN